MPFLQKPKSLSSYRGRREEGGSRTFLDIMNLISRCSMANQNCKNDAPGMKGCRSRNQSGLLRDKRDDTHIGTVEKQYGIDLGVRSDMQLETYLEKHGIKSLNDLITGP